MLNNQKPEKTCTLTDLLDVHSVFTTIQGEGPYSGRAAVFVRLAGCNLQCPGCDTEYTHGRAMHGFKELYDKVVKSKSSCGSKTMLVVITGGEPFRQVATVPFCNYLSGLGYKVQVETNGVLEIDKSLHETVTVVCSPKTAKLHPNNLARINAFKYVINRKSVNHEDGLPIQALEHRASPHVARPPYGFDGPVYIQPMDCQDVGLNKLNVNSCIDIAQEHGHIMQIQLHKVLGVE